MEFERFLDLLIAKGVRVYDGPFIVPSDKGLDRTPKDSPRLHLEFGAPPLPLAPAGALVDAEGKPVNLDEGMGELGKDPDASDDPLVAANFPGAPKAS